MRSTVRIDDDLMDELKQRAEQENLSLSRMLNRTLRAGLRAGKGTRSGQRPYREQVFAMGEPEVNLDKALAAAAQLEDAEILRKLAARK